MEWLIASAHAQAAGGAQPNALLQMLPLLLIFVVFYFLLIRPQAKRAKEHKAMVAALGTGDEVVIGGGLLGRITETGDQFLTVENCQRRPGQGATSHRRQRAAQGHLEERLS